MKTSNGMKYTPAGILVATFLALLPFVTTSSLFYGSISAKFFYIILFTEVFVLVGAYHLYKRREPLMYRSRWLLGALALFIAIEYLSSFLGVFPARSLWSDIFWSSGVLFLTHIAFLAVLVGEILTEHDWALARRAVAISAGLASLLLIIGLQGFGVTSQLLFVNLGETGITFGNETYAGIYLVLAFVMGCIELSRTKEWSLSRSVLLGSVILTALSPLLFNLGLLLGRVSLVSIFTSPAVLLGTARASSAALFALLVFIAGYVVLNRFITKPLRGRLILAWSAVILVVLTALVALLFTPGSAVQEAYIKEATAARVIVWGAGLDAVKDRPFFGWGPENFNYAIERHFDSQLFLEKNLAEIWFDRAHNVFVDTLVTSGVVGTVATALLAAAYLLAVFRARRRGLIEETETVLLYALVPVQLLQLQTGFDTVASYTLLAVFGGYALSLERRMAEAGEGIKINDAVWKGIAGVLVALTLLSFFFILLPEYARESALPLIFKGQSVEQQTAELRTSLDRVSSFESLRNSSASFIKGSLALIAENPPAEAKKRILDYAHIYDEYYDRYLVEKPDDYRARMNYAYLLLTQMTLGENRVDDARKIIQGSYDLSPKNPITYILAALAELYGGNPAESDRLMKEALAINPDIEFTQAAAAYFERQKKIFPNLTVLKLENL